MTHQHTWHLHEVRKSAFSLDSHANARLAPSSVWYCPCGKQRIVELSDTEVIDLAASDKEPV